MRLIITWAAALTGFLLTWPGQAQEAETVYRGRPTVKITVAATEQRSEKVESKDAPNLTCVISKIGENFYWASRENRPLTPSRSGAFLVFVAEGGTGYIKIIIPDMKEAAALMGETEAKYDYVEHITFGLGSVTYYGKPQQ
jgi:hypothetical protein